MIPIAKSLIAAQREASRRVGEARKFSIKLPLIGTVRVPPPEQLAIFSALGGLTALGILDWPVALAMGIGSAVVGRQLSEVEAREEELAEAIKPVVSPSAAKKAPAKKAPAKKAPAQKAPAKAAAKKAPAKKAPAKKAAKQAPDTKAPPAAD
ncbi:MAG: hypothetical protein KDB71_13365 [Mycobacterium sp.]|nr:hypothetical protein [Mycobacterium sp.]